MLAPDDVVIVGGRELVLSPGQVEIAREGEWSLHRLPTSDCGKYQNLKLYFYGSRAKKRVWRLCVFTTSSTLVRNRDAAILNEYYAGMADWVIGALNGDVGQIPKFEKRVKKKKSAVPISGELEIGSIVRIIDEAWRAGRPLSIYGQTKKAGRYAPQVIGDAIGVSQQDVGQTILAMLEEGKLETEVFDVHTKLKGLKLTNQGVQHG